jgi:exopolysaccharide biosynthesis polyprenyl glycosylphosphotransferase
LRADVSNVERPNAPTFNVLGTSRDLVRLVKEHSVPEVILAVSHSISSSLFQALLECKEQGVQITLMPVLFEQLTGQVPIEHIGDNWNIALPLDSAEAGGFYPIAKRLFDITGALIGLSLYALIFPFIALAVRLDSPGPIFYTQERVGKGGRVFQLVKMRTMIQDAEPGGRAVRAQAGDARITRVGRWLRKARLDEMPQLINILKGDMSAVGPRPERPEHLAELDQAIPFHRLRNAVKPGMAGWAVVNYDYIESVEDARIRLQYDLYYIKHQSLWLDLLILLRTMGHMLTLRGR